MLFAKSLITGSRESLRKRERCCDGFFSGNSGCCPRRFDLRRRRDDDDDDDVVDDDGVVVDGVDVNDNEVNDDDESDDAEGVVGTGKSSAVAFDGVAATLASAVTPATSDGGDSSLAMPSPEAGADVDSMLIGPTDAAERSGDVMADAANAATDAAAEAADETADSDIFVAVTTLHSPSPSPSPPPPVTSIVVSGAGDENGDRNDDGDARDERRVARTTASCHFCSLLAVSKNRRNFCFRGRRRRMVSECTSPTLDCVICKSPCFSFENSTSPPSAAAPALAPSMPPSSWRRLRLRPHSSDSSATSARRVPLLPTGLVNDKSKQASVRNTSHRRSFAVVNNPFTS
jgi:hypothetical protein